MSTPESRSPDEEDVVEARRQATFDRFRQLRRRRLGIRAMVSSAAVAAGVFLAITLAPSGTGPARVVVGAPTGPTTQPSTTTTLAAPGTTTAGTVPPALAPPVSSPPTTKAKPSTTIPATSTTAPPPCSDQQFSTRVATDHPTYTRGQTVAITVTTTNSGPTCYGLPPWEGCGYPVSAYNSSHTDVWDWHAGSNTLPINCPADIYQNIPHGASGTTPVSWAQDQCTSPNNYSIATNPNCPGTQVPDGVYNLVVDTNKAQTTITITG